MRQCHPSVQNNGVGRFFVTVATVENVFCLHSPKDGNILKGMKCDRKDLGSRSLWNYAIKGG